MIPYLWILAKGPLTAFGIALARLKVSRFLLRRTYVSVEQQWVLLLEDVKMGV